MKYVSPPIHGEWNETLYARSPDPSALFFARRVWLARLVCCKSQPKNHENPYFFQLCPDQQTLELAFAIGSICLESTQTQSFETQHTANTFYGFMANLVTGNVRGFLHALNGPSEICIQKLLGNMLDTMRHYS